MSITLDKLNCKVCGSPNTVKDGLIKGVQRWECKACGCKFLDNGALPGMKTPFTQAASALRMHYEGMSLNSIRKQLQSDFRVNPSRSSIFKWTNIYPNRVLEAVKNSRPVVGETWIVLETALTLCHQKLWAWDVVDKDTSFLLTTVISEIRSPAKLKILIKKAVERADKTPKWLISDTLSEYLNRLSCDFDTDGGYGKKRSFIVENASTVQMMDLHKVFQERSTLISGLKSIVRAKQFADGWLAHYNYFKRQDALGGRTPAELADIEYPQLRVAYFKATRQRN